MKTATQIAEPFAARFDETEASYDNIRNIIAEAIEADRAQRADMAAFGEFVHELMDGEEWSSDTLQAIGEYATFTLKKPFTEPGE